VFDVGKGGPDIVITTSATDADVGTTKWILHSNTGSRFRDGPLEWMLPSDFEPGTFTNFYDSSTTDKVVWAMVDLDGDGSLDIVVTDTDSGSGGIGSTRWLLYTNTGDGFSPTSTNWSLPSGFNDGALDTVGDGASDDGVTWSLTDLNGDGVPDIVVTDSDAETTTGNASWSVYAGGAGGFAGTSSAWSLPTGLGTNLFTSLYDAAPEDGVSFGLANLGEDNVSDLVFVKNAADAEVGRTYWQQARANCQ
jgi:hypothetical protein